MDAINAISKDPRDAEYTLEAHVAARKTACPACHLLVMGVKPWSEVAHCGSCKAEFRVGPFEKAI